MASALGDGQLTADVRNQKPVYETFACVDTGSASPRIAGESLLFVRFQLAF